jgi:hypothetical protein
MRPVAKSTWQAHRAERHQQRSIVGSGVAAEGGELGSVAGTSRISSNVEKPNPGGRCP